MRRLIHSALVVFLFALSVHAQFQFFEQMFQGGHQHQHQQEQQPQNVASDSSWYRQNYEAGNTYASMSDIMGTSILIRRQLIAPTTSAPERSHACISPITALAPFRKSRIRWNWAMGLRFVFRRVVSRLGKRHGRLSWRRRGCYDI